MRRAIGAGQSYGIPRTTVHNWLARLERLPEERFGDVIYDADLIWTYSPSGSETGFSRYSRNLCPS